MDHSPSGEWITFRAARPRQALIDDSDLGRRGGVLLVERPSGHFRNTERVEEMDPDGIVGRGLVSAYVTRFTLRQERSLEVATPAGGRLCVSSRASARSDV